MFTRPSWGGGGGGGGTKEDKKEGGSRLKVKEGREAKQQKMSLTQVPLELDHYLLLISSTTHLYNLDSWVPVPVPHCNLQGSIPVTATELSNRNLEKWPPISTNTMYEYN